VTIDLNLVIYLLCALQVIGFAVVGLLGWRIARGPVRDATSAAKGLVQSGTGLVETGKNLAALGAQAQAIGEGARATRAAVGLAPPPAGMLVTPQRLIKGIGYARSAHGLWKTRALPKKKPSVGFRAAQKLGLIPPIAPALFRAFGIGKTAFTVARKRAGKG
jgi:hypothetical protein